MGALPSIFSDLHDCSALALVAKVRMMRLTQPLYLFTHPAAKEWGGETSVCIVDITRVVLWSSPIPPPITAADEQSLYAMQHGGFFENGAQGGMKMVLTKRIVRTSE